jgi:hypothetical protein
MRGWKNSWVRRVVEKRVEISLSPVAISGGGGIKLHHDYPIPPPPPTHPFTIRVRLVGLRMSTHTRYANKQGIMS